MMKRDDQFIYYNNLGNDNFFQENYQDARDCFRKAADLVKGDEAKLWDYYTALGNLGEIYICLHQADSARQLIEQVDSFFHRVNFPPLIYYMATSRMELKMLEGDMQGALAIASASPKDDISSPAAKVLRLKALEQLMRKTGRWQEAMNVHEELHGLNDSIHAAQSAMRMSAQLYQYKHDKERMKQQQEIDHQKCNQGNLARRIDGRVIDLDRQNGLRVKSMHYLVAHDFQGDDAACALEAARRTAGTSAKEHAQAEHDPCDVMPLRGILVEHARCGEE